MSAAELATLVAEVARGELAIDHAVIRPPPALRSRLRLYALAKPQLGADETTWGAEDFAGFASIIVLVAFTDVAVDYALVHDVVPRLVRALDRRAGTTVCEPDHYMASRKEVAALAGLGTIGRNALFFSRRFGFNCKIDLVATHLAFDRYADTPAEATLADHRLGPCLRCTVCVPACPVAAYDDFALNDPIACDKHITPDWYAPERMCRSCITSCPPSNTLLQRLHDKGLPRGRLPAPPPEPSTSPTPSARRASPEHVAAGPVLAVPRNRTAVARLGGGTLVVVGGVTDAPLASCEALAPDADAWGQAPALNEARAGHTVTRLGSGALWTVGGNGTRRHLRAIEALAPGGTSWQVVAVLVVGRAGHTSTLLPDGRILVVGGSMRRVFRPRAAAVVHECEAELVDPKTGTSRATSPPAFARLGHTATLLADGRVFIAGGRIAGEESLHRSAWVGPTEVFDPTTERWCAAAVMSAPRSFHTATRLHDGRVLVVGGYHEHVSLASAVLYDPVRDLLTETGALATARSSHSATLLPDGGVLVVAGIRGEYAIDDGERWHPDEPRWRPALRLASARCGHEASLSADGRSLLVIGGAREGRALADVEVVLLGDG